MDLMLQNAVCCLSPSLSAWDDPAPLRDAVWQLLLCGQQAGDAQQGRLFLQRRAVGKPPSCNPPPFLSFSFPVLDIFDNPVITSGPETDELMDKSLALNTPVSLPVSSMHFHSGTELPGQSDFSLCLFFFAGTLNSASFILNLYQRAWVSVWAANTCSVCT